MFGMNAHLCPELFLEQGQVLDRDGEILVVVHEFLSGLAEFLGIGLLLILYFLLVEVLRLLFGLLLLLHLLLVELSFPSDLAVQLLVLVGQQLQVG